MLGALPVAPDPAPPEFDGLGYRGFRVTDCSGRTEFRVQQGCVFMRQEGPPRVKADPARQIERVLLETARPHLEPADFLLAQALLGETAGD
jgi:hypothetical protein